MDKLLMSLAGRVSAEAESLFLNEALICFRNGAFRATIVMAWNLAFDHLLNWVMVNHLVAFNARIAVRYPRKSGLTISRREDFEELRESEVIEICNSAGLFSGNINKILCEKLSRRNMAAHPSLIQITQVQAEDVVTDLIGNVVLKLV